MSKLVASQVTSPLHSPVKISPLRLYCIRCSDCCQSSIFNSCIANPVQSVKQCLHYDDSYRGCRMAVERTRATRTVLTEPESRYHGLLRPMGGFAMYHGGDVVALVQDIESM